MESEDRIYVKGIEESNIKDGLSGLSPYWIPHSVQVMGSHGVSY